jgi:hypothetical protein
MNKKILIALLVVLLAGGGMAFAQSGLGSGLLGLDTPPVIEDEDDGRKFGEEVSELAREIDPDNLTEENLEAENEENGEDERSEVAEAVLEVLGGELSPGDEGFGNAVADQAREDGRALGEDVSNAAREANGSKGASGR